MAVPFTTLYVQRATVWVVFDSVSGNGYWIFVYFTNFITDGVVPLVTDEPAVSECPKCILIKKELGALEWSVCFNRYIPVPFAYTLRIRQPGRRDRGSIVFYSEYGYWIFVYLTHFPTDGVVPIVTDGLAVSGSRVGGENFTNIMGRTMTFRPRLQ